MTRRLPVGAGPAVGRSLALAVFGCALLCACEGQGGQKAQQLILKDHAPRVAKVVREDLERHRVGLQKAGDRIAVGFAKADPERIAPEMRQAFKIIRNPKRGIRELVISPMSFMASVGMDGIVIARNTEDDKMQGMDLGKQYEPVRKALAGEAAYGIAEFDNPTNKDKPSVTILMAAPAHYEGKVVGALVVGIPLWRMAQRLSKQLQMEAAGKEAGVVLWVYLYRGDELHNFGAPKDLEELVPDAATRKAGLAKSPGGFTGSVQQYGFWYGFGVRPLPSLGADVGAVVIRMDPQK